MSQFLEAVFSDAIQYPNFFNGRILTATDLRDEQDAFLKLARYLGQAAGTGVVYGLEVAIAPDSDALEISGGLALNPKGDALALPADQTVPLTLKNRPAPTTDSPFVPCDLEGATGLNGVVTTNYYLLALTSTTRLSPELAHHSGLGGDGRQCTSRFEEMGVQFKLVPLATTDLKTLPDLAAPIDPNAPQSRSQLAHRCFGTEMWLQYAANPLEMGDRYGLTDALRINGKLTDCDVPLAVFFYRSQRVQFVDMWAVRRPCLPGMRPLTYPAQLGNAALQEPLSQFVSPRRAVEAAALLLQFQTQLENWRRSSSNAKQVTAADRFEYLPAAGIVPLGNAGFDIKTFFGVDPNAVLWFDDPALIRSLIHESFYQDPIRPGEPVTLYRFDDAPDGDPYVLFVRQAPVPELREPDEPEPPVATPTATGNLTVVVTDVRGEVVSPNLITSVQAQNIKTRQVYLIKKPSKQTGSKFIDRQLQAELSQAKARTRQKYQILIAQATAGDRPARRGKAEKIDGFAIAKDSNTFYRRSLPVGVYTVTANLVSRSDNLYSVPVQVKIKANRSELATVVVRVRPIGPIDDFRVPGGGQVIPGGGIIDDVIIDPKWADLYPGWQDNLPGLNPGNIDPIPDAWINYRDPDILLGVESVLGQTLNDPAIAAADPTLYVSQTYRPDQVATDVEAFVQTADGSRFPVVLVAADNALDKPTAAARAPIPDFDRGTVARLESAGLGDLDAIASAPAGLVAAVLGQDVTYSQSLISESRASLQNDFQEGFMGFAGIDKAASDQLKTQLGGKLDLANLDLDVESAALATFNQVLSSDRFSEPFKGRFLQDVRSVVPAQSFSLEGTGLSTQEQATLAESGITTNKRFRETAATPEGKATLQDRLGVSAATLDRYVEAATLGFAQGEFLTTPEKSVVALPGATAEVAKALTNAGVASAKDLANRNAAELANRTGFSEAEIGSLIETASGFASNAHVTLATGATGGAVTATELENAGLKSVGAIAQIDAAATPTIDNTNAVKIKAANAKFLESQGELLRGRFRGGSFTGGRR